MAKYRGKYKKCRECKHSEEVLMMLVEVKESCPNHIKFSSMPDVIIERPPKTMWQLIVEKRMPPTRTAVQRWEDRRYPKVGEFFK